MNQESDRRREFGRLAKERRQKLKLSVRAAAILGGVDRATWQGMEDATRETQDRNYTGIEQALQLGSGSISAYIEHGRPLALLGDVDAEGPPEPDVEPEKPSQGVALLGAAFEMFDDPAEFEAAARELTQARTQRRTQSKRPNAAS